MSNGRKNAHKMGSSPSKAELYPRRSRAEMYQQLWIERRALEAAGIADRRVYENQQRQLIDTRHKKRDEVIGRYQHGQ